ncbi:MAG: oxygenase MpaB family protein [Ilumatobacteraceae bacterium]
MTTLPSPVDERVQQVRRVIAEALRSRVIGPDAETKQAAVMLAPGERWFAADRPVHIVHSDASMFIGGMRALLLQSLHPLAMTGVAEHSDYRRDPWGRLQRTADFLATTTFGPADAAQQAVDRVNAVHGHVHGTASDGRAYSARDPHLLRWVHVAEIDSFLRAHATYGAVPLTPAQADGYVEDMAVIARKLGVKAPPLSVRGLRDQLRMFRPELMSTPQSRDAARYLLLEPPLDAAARVPYLVIASAAIATLPAWARAELRIPYLPLADALVSRPLGNLVARTIRWATAIDAVSPATPASS